MILFRCDSSFQIGTGHVTRCLHFAKLIQATNPHLPIEFLCQDLPGNISHTLTSAGFQVHISDEDDIAVITKLHPQWLIVDHYDLDETWERKVSRDTRIFVIDDLVNRKHFCQVLLDQNYHSSPPPYQNLVPADCRLLIGPTYCLINPDLKKPLLPKILHKPIQVLTFFGGSDESGELLRFARALSQSPNGKFQFHLVALKSHRHLNELQSLNLPSHIQLHIAPTHWKDLLASMDFYIGSGGTVTWERMFLGVPGAVISVAQNQEQVSQDLSNDGYQFYWGPCQNFDYSTVLSRLDFIFAKPSGLQSLQLKCSNLVSHFSRDLIKEFFN